MQLSNNTYVQLMKIFIFVFVLFYILVYNKKYSIMHVQMMSNLMGQ